MDEDRVLALAEITQRDPAAAAQLLEVAGGSIEAAIALHFEGGIGDTPRRPQNPRAPPDGMPRPPPQSLMEELNQDLVENPAPRVYPHPVTIEAVPGSFLALLLSPLRILKRVLDWCLMYLQFGAHAPQVIRSPDTFDPKRIASRHRVWIEEVAGKSAPWLFEGGYLAALEASKQQLKYLVVILMSQVHEDSPRYVREVLFGEQFRRAVLARDDIIVWSGSVQESESYQLALNFGMSKLPMIVVVAPSPKTPQSSTIVMAALGRYIGLPVDEESDTGSNDSIRSGMNASTGRRLSRHLEELFETHAPKLMALKLDRQRADSARQVRQEQDSAYERSLQADRCRETERAAREQQQNNRKLKVDAWKRAKHARYFGVNTDTATTSESNSSTTRVLIRLPDGQRLVYRFRSDETVQDVYDYIYVFLHPPEPTEEPAGLGNGQDPELPPDFDYGFDLMSPILRKSVPYSRTQLVNEPAIWPNGSLTVDYHEEEDNV